MINKKIIAICAAAVIGLAFSASAYSNWWPFSGDDDKDLGPVTEITWADFVPSDFVQPENPFLTMTQEEVDKLMDGSEESDAEIARLEKEFTYAPVVPELDGQRIKFPAYITPLEYDNPEFVKEFLLVPYVGACMHTPPPPANQIVHTESAEPIKYPGMYEAVWATGIIRADAIETNLATTGYHLELDKIEPYVAPEQEAK